MVKLLFLTRSFPDTHRSATIQCTHRILECARTSSKYEIHVLCLQYEGEKKEEVIKGIYVHRVKPSIWIRIRHYIEQNGWYRLDHIFESLQKIGTVFFYPNTLPLTTKIYTKVAIKLMGKESFDVVLSEYHGLMTLKAGCCLKKKNNHVVHIAFLWDPLKGELMTKYLPFRFSSSRMDSLERFVAKNTTLEISMAVMKEYFENQKDYALNHRFFLDIPTILPPEKEIKTEYLKLLKEESINIVYSGKLSLTERNPLPIIDLLNKTEVAERVNLVFFSMGAKDAIEGSAISFKGTIAYHDFIPLKDLHTVYRFADYLLNISHINPNMVPSKLFEYMSYGKPIISTFVSEGDAAEKCIKRYPEGLCIDLRHKSEDNVDELNNFILKQHKPVAFEMVKNMYEDNTPEKYLEIIEDTLCSHQ